MKNKALFAGLVVLHIALLVLVGTGSRQQVVLQQRIRALEQRVKEILVKNKQGNRQHTQAPDCEITPPHSAQSKSSDTDPQLVDGQASRTGADKKPEQAEARPTDHAEAMVTEPNVVSSTINNDEKVMDSDREAGSANRSPNDVGPNADPTQNEVAVPAVPEPAATRTATDSDVPMYLSLPIGDLQNGQRPLRGLIDRKIGYSLGISRDVSFVLLLVREAATTGKIPSAEAKLKELAAYTSTRTVYPPKRV